MQRRSEQPEAPRTRSNSPPTASKEEGLEREADCKIYIDAKDWEGKDLYKAIEDGHLTSDQAESIMKLRAAIGRDARQPHQQKLGHSSSGSDEQPDGSNKSTGNQSQGKGELTGGAKLQNERIIL